MYNSFAVILPELDIAESRLISQHRNPYLPFILQNVGLATGFDKRF
jgi:hypothetical protein